VIEESLQHGVTLQKTTGRDHAATISPATNTSRLTSPTNNNRRRCCIQIPYEQPCSCCSTPPFTTTNTSYHHDARLHHCSSRSPRTHQLINSPLPRPQIPYMFHSLRQPTSSSTSSFPIVSRIGGLVSREFTMKRRNWRSSILWEMGGMRG
jgi:hypothetical protein